MELPDLPPDITFPRLGTSPSNVTFAFEVKRVAMGPHIQKHWTWDEDFQRKLHQQRYEEKPIFAIQRDRLWIGTLSFQVFVDHVRFGEFYLLDAYQAKGIGSAVLAHCLAIADNLDLPVRLEYLHWNPVGSLYRRHSFVEVGRSEIHCFMERPKSRMQVCS